MVCFSILAQIAIRTRECAVWKQEYNKGQDLRPMVLDLDLTFIVDQGQDHR